MAAETSFAGTFTPDRDQLAARRPRAEGVGLIEVYPDGILIRARCYASSNPFVVLGLGSAGFLVGAALMTVVRKVDTVLWPMLAIVLVGALYSIWIDRVGRDLDWHVPWDRADVSVAPGNKLVVRINPITLSEAGRPRLLWFRPAAAMPGLLQAIRCAKEGRAR